MNKDLNYSGFRFIGSEAVKHFSGSRHSNKSIFEAIEKIEICTDKKAKIRYKYIPRLGDYVWYISNIYKFRKDYPEWEYKYNIDQIITELCTKSHNNYM